MAWEATLLLPPVLLVLLASGDEEGRGRERGKRRGRWPGEAGGHERATQGGLWPEAPVSGAHSEERGAHAPAPQYLRNGSLT